jgi:hypothetical protein
VTQLAELKVWGWQDACSGLFLRKSANVCRKIDGCVCLEAFEGELRSRDLCDLPRGRQMTGRLTWSLLMRLVPAKQPGFCGATAQHRILSKDESACSFRSCMQHCGFVCLGIVAFSYLPIVLFTIAFILSLCFFVFLGRIA